MKKQITLKISGKVQGVFFRDFSCIKAIEFNLSGYVKNDEDGTVSIVAEGEDKDLRSFIEWCKYGPDSAEVERVDIKWLEPIGSFFDFKVL